MEFDIFIVDAFTDQRFKGNSAAVVPVETWPDAAVMQDIALENNLSETAFIRRAGDNQYEIRWFSPLTEIAFCGHATLAASFVLFTEYGLKGEIEYLTTQVGSLTVSQREGNRIEMSFPNQKPEPVSIVPNALLQGLTIKPVQVLKNRQAYFAVMESEADVKAVGYDTASLKQLAPLDVVVTAASTEYDFTSRYFWPANGGDEDPVTGSIHAGLAPYWSERLQKTELVARQASKRGGVLHCVMAEDRVLVSGHGVLYLKGKIYL
ncbi:phenazine biosynthesis PhzC/PhzF protein [Oceanimonas sp. GK1]|uniref:PhzF family phenazine biosynthesis protein n=1 Tax=Oceanimonas sp. (strain GK1 / IBRC-M 10197) TaxID=511062 RepID=UPI0002494C80|nr:PhzF family phenazine biosynthesis protein [Oceanimonas sp. GK1]AEX99848.1 phenazine biosynthesis PhzC/PhzF protein [Oceanimonas sp. GK1]